MNLSDLFSELRRRRVFRVTGIYALLGWLAIQIAATTFPVLMLPTWTVRFVVALFLLGVPIVVVLAWMFDITPGGVERTTPTAASEGAPPPAAGVTAPAAPRRGARHVPWALAVLLLAALGMSVYRYAPLELSWHERAGALPAPQDELDLSIAVLPFTNLSADADNEYFSDGITEDILTRLSRVAGLRVTSRTSVMGYKGTTKNLRQIGAELGVGHILEGSVRRSGDRVRITAQLIEARGDQHLWSETFDRQLDDIFTIQSEIATAIAGALQLQLSAGERSRLERAATGSVTAYDLYLRGREHMYRNITSRADQVANMSRAIAHFREALAEDRTFHLAHVGLARAWAYRVDLPLGERRDSVILYARRALAGDAELAQAHVHIAMAYAMTGDDDAAVREFRRALEMAPDDPEVLGTLARHHHSRGRYDEAIRLATRAVALDPGSVDTYDWIWSSYMLLGDLHRAESWVHRHFERLPHPGRMHSTLGHLALLRGDLRTAEEQHRLALLHVPDGVLGLRQAARFEISRGNYEMARQYHARAVAISGEDDLLLDRAVVALRTGDRAAADALLHRLDASVRPNWEGCAGTCINEVLAASLALRGQRDEALDYLQRAVEHGWRGIHNLESRLGSFDDLADEPRYLRLIAQVRADLQRQRASLAGEGL